MADIERFEVRFDDEAFAEDLAHATVAGRAVAYQPRERLERDGLVASETRPCRAEGREGTRLAGCVKVYLPAPAGQWSPSPLSVRARMPSGDGADAESHPLDRSGLVK